jgi:hypothetical protein
MAQHLRDELYYEDAKQLHSASNKKFGRNKTKEADCFGKR